jgi:signal transduction histidine kinase
MDPTIKPNPLPFPNRRKTVRRDEDVWKNRHTEVLEALLMGVMAELRTPLTAARTFVEALKDLDNLEILREEDAKIDVKIEEATPPGQLTTKQLTKEEAQDVYLDRLSKNIQRVIALVEWARLPVQASDCQINTIVERELEIRRGYTETNGISIRCRGLENLPSILAYEWRLSHVFSTLIGCAIVGTPPGGSVTVTGRVNQDEGTVIVEVEKTGPGIALQLCDTFNRGEELKCTEIPPFIVGDPFDLQKARKVAEIHGGRISVESREGAGTKFSISFPVRCVAPKPVVFEDAKQQPSS